MGDKAAYKIRLTGYNGNESEEKSSTHFFDNLIKNKTEDEKDEWLDTDEAANYLRLTPNALRIMVHRATVKFYKLGSRLRFRKGDLVSLLQKVEE